MTTKICHIENVLDVRDAAVAVQRPLVFDSPHSGTTYPLSFDAALPVSQLRRAEDTHVDDLYGAAPAHGGALLRAFYPRAFIDANRKLSELDPSLLEDGWADPLQTSSKTGVGSGLIWSLCPPDQAPIYDRKLSRAEVQDRIARYYRPYHMILRDLIRERHGRFGQVLHVNCHSMRSSSRLDRADGAENRRPDFILGDRDGTTCDPDFFAFLHETISGYGFSVGRNEIFRGQELVAAYSAPGAGVSSVQIEINRGLYMNEETTERRPDYDAFRDVITDLIGKIASYADACVAPA